MHLQRLVVLFLLLEIAACHRNGKVVQTPNISGPQISGWVSDVEGKPLESPLSTVVLRDLPSGVIYGGLGRRTPLRTNGTFEFSDVPPGRYSISLAGLAANFSPIVPVEMMDASIRNIELVVPRRKEINGRITVEGNGPLPEVRFELTPIGGMPSNPAIIALSRTGYVTNNSFPAAVPISLAMNLIPRADGTFATVVPDGNWTLKMVGELPSGYSIKTLTYGSADVLTSPMEVRLSKDDTLHLTVAASDMRLAEVHGRITGVSNAMIARGPISVTLRGPISQTSPGQVSRPLTADVRADGSFDFQGVLPGNYSALVTGLGVLDLAVARLSVADVDIRNFEIEILQHEVSGQIVVEGGGAIPVISLNFRSVQGPGLTVVGYIATPSVTIRPLPDGSFQILLPVGQRQINAGAVPARGYTVKSITYGATDVLNSPLNISKSDTEQLRITLIQSSPATK